jgi:hypothetical protein
MPAPVSKLDRATLRALLAAQRQLARPGVVSGRRVATTPSPVASVGTG